MSSAERPPQSPSFGTSSLDELLGSLATTPRGLTGDDAVERLKAAGKRIPPASQVILALRTFAAQFRSPITLILIVAAMLSVFLQNVTDAAIILAIVMVGAVLGFWQEFSAANALAALGALVSARSTVLRDGQPVEVPNDHVVTGDVLLLSAGSTIPGDCRLLDAHDLFVDESSLTGESFPVEKHVGTHAVDAPLTARVNVVHHGTHVVSGAGSAVVALTGEATELGRISHRLRLRSPETDFERGVRRFGTFLLEVTLLLVFAIFVTHLALGRPPFEALVFSLALAVGLTPQLLPAVISVNLAQGARRLAALQVIVRRLSSIENFGSMNVLCSDKTGTLTEGHVRVDRCVDFAGQDHAQAMFLASVNASFETGFANPLDEALRRQFPITGRDVEKLDEIPYDFLRKRLSVLARVEGCRLLIVKGALDKVLSICVRAERADGTSVPIDEARPAITERFEELGRTGFRTLAVAYREHFADRVTHADEADMTFAGLLVLHDPPKEGVGETIKTLRELGIALKIISGDNRIVVGSLSARVGLDTATLLTGGELRELSDDALMRRAAQTDVFAEIEPNQKERIVLALKRSGNVVGYLGDGINDATALHAADVGISVDQAVDVAKEAADIVLLQHDLNVLIQGVRQGRATFANTLKYIFLATSANFGNMLSMAGVSLFLPFLPLLPKQILLTNLLTDFPEMTIASDRVDPEMVDLPQRWNLRTIQHFMLVFGLLSSVFDFATFGTLLWLLGASETEFRTGWFVESVISACAVVLIVRSRRPLWSSRPAPLLVGATALVVVTTLLLAYLPWAETFGFASLSPKFLGAMLVIVVLYAASAEVVKRWFYGRMVVRR